VGPLFLAGRVSAFVLGRVSLLSELAGREDRLIHTNLESGWLMPPCPGGSPAGEGLAIVTFSPVYVRVTNSFLFGHRLAQRTRVGFLKSVVPQ
jgi:hypothetical protein